jgi:uncharacterized protein
MMKTQRQDIDQFLAQRRIALVGISRDDKDFSRTLFRELQQRGYDVVPVNPQASEVDGVRCYGRMQEIEPPVEGALLMTPPAVTEQVVRDCAEAGVRRVWMHQGAGTGAVSPAAVDYCAGQGMSVIAGHCPFMFLPGTAFFHRFHGFIKKVSGTYPVG